MHKALQKQSRRLRRVRTDDIIREAEDGTDPRKENMHGLFTLIKRIAPKQVKKREQLRAESGRLLEPAEEATELANYWKSVNGSTCGYHTAFNRQDWSTIGPCMHFSKDETRCITGKQSSTSTSRTTCTLEGCGETSCRLRCRGSGGKVGHSGHFSSSGVGCLLASFPESTQQGWK